MEDTMFMPQGVSAHLLPQSDETLLWFMEVWSFVFCSAEVRHSPRGPSRGCLLSANIIILFVCRWWSCVCVYVSVCAHAVGRGIELYGFIKTLPSVSTATSFSPLLQLCSSSTPHTAVWHVPPLFFVSPHSHSFPACVCTLTTCQFPLCFSVILLHGFHPPPSPFFHTVICASTTPSPLLRFLSSVSLPPSLFLSSLHCYVWALSSGCTFHFGIVLSMHCCIQSS